MRKRPQIEVFFMSAVLFMAISVTFSYLTAIKASAALSIWTE
jgi:hypothetical protein